MPQIPSDPAPETTEPDNMKGGVRETEEIEIKVLTRAGASDFNKIQQMLDDKDLGHGQSWSKTLSSCYYDTEAHDLYNAGKALRIRYEFNRQSRAYSAPDISTKNLGENFGHGIIRTELEADLDDLAIDLDVLYDDYAGDEDAIAYLDELTDDFGNAPQHLREIFNISCERTNVKAVTYVCRGDDGTPRVVKKTDLAQYQGQDVKKVVFEFSLDHSSFFIYRPDENGERRKPFKIHEDFEVELEFKLKGCPFDPDPDESDEGVTNDEIQVAQDYIVNLMISTLDEDDLDWTGLSKQERGFSAVKKYEDKHGETELFNRATAFGIDIPAMQLTRKTNLKPTGTTHDTPPLKPAP